MISVGESIGGVVIGAVALLVAIVGVVLLACSSYAAYETLLNYFAAKKENAKLVEENKYTPLIQKE